MSDGRLQRRGNGSHTAIAGRQRPGAIGSPSTAELRTALAERLRQRLPELRGAVATRVHAIADPHEVVDPGYLQGLDAALVAAIDYRLAVLEAGERHAPPVPPVLLAHARLDARDRVPLDTVLRRYFAGNALFADFLGEEAERARVSSSELRRLLGEQATAGDRLLAAVSAEHAHEANNRPGSAAERRRECVKRLLAGELVDHSDLGYDLDAQHLAVMAKGEGAQDVVRALARKLDRRLLAVQREEEPTWACWLGGQRPLAAEEAVAAARELAPGRFFLTVGESGEGLSGWRFSHRQAKVALPVAERMGEPLVRYGEIAVLASIARDDLLENTLRQLYLEPLERARDGGKLARLTLRAYFAAGRNVSSTAAALGVDRRTVGNRLRAVEQLLGRPLEGSQADLEIALRLDDD
ncbi:MAG TPA: helix-turn-helix domain-containing protein [Solirubrobacterales bacterium]|nr:helix-turn-helix domain-containing protein [Solirubrobacterales bacterium]